MVDNTNFKYQTSKILQLLYESGKSGLINEEERVHLKGNFIISNNLITKNNKIKTLCFQLISYFITLILLPFS